MDLRYNMIIANGKPISSNVTNCVYNQNTQKWDITFNNGKIFHYNSQNVGFLKNPIVLNPQNFKICSGGKLLDNIAGIYAFRDNAGEYWHIRFSNGYEHDYLLSELQVTQSVLDSQQAKSVFSYLREIAGLISVRTEDDTAILSKQYEKIDFLKNDTAAAAYLKPDIYNSKTGLNVATPIFPFGCNESQYKAVTNALSNRISVIEGPPGTGKTQTILNIIANLVIQGKSVQVVSNNNSAIDNVIEKLSSPKYQMDFIVAQLGRDERKETFISSQSGCYPNISGWRNDIYESQDFLNHVRDKSLELQAVFSDKNRLAQLRKEQYDVSLEKEHLKILSNDNKLRIFTKKISSSRIMEFWHEYQDIQDGAKKIGFLYRLSRRISLGIDVRKLIGLDSAFVSDRLQNEYYVARLEEIDSEIKVVNDRLSTVNATAMMDELTNLSLLYFRAKLAKRFNCNMRRQVFSKDSLWKVPEQFIKEYPIVLSTTYTARSSLGRNAQFDYCIMDEASQVDVATGMLALSCASNAVIVGDTKQLPNVVTEDQKKMLSSVFSRYNIAAEYDFTTHSFLSSICELFGEKIPRVTLCEHYRCAPQIIGFCNQKFYNGELIVMTNDEDRSALQLVTTVAGNHERDRLNQRQAEVIRTEILPRLNCLPNEIGIIAPYRNQVELLKSVINDSRIEIDTVHKFQGREKDVIILSTVDDTVTEFSDDPNLLNVAVSRAKKKLIVVAAGQEQPAGSNVGDLIGYIRYNNCDIQHSSISSVFDYLYDQYEASRLEYLKKHKRISEYDSENLMYGLIQEVLSSHGNNTLGVVCHQPLRQLFRDYSKMTDEEKAYVCTGASHLDFLIYNKVSKQPVMGVEVDGFNYHRAGSKQAERDALKNHILEVYSLPLIRFATNGSGEREILEREIEKIIGY